MEWKERVRHSAFFPPHNCPLDGLIEIGSALCLQNFKTSVEFLAKKVDKVSTINLGRFPNMVEFEANLNIQHRILAVRIQLMGLNLSQAMNGFLLLATQTGKLLYISDNAAEYLGHSMVSDSTVLS